MDDAAEDLHAAAMSEAQAAFALALTETSGPPLSEREVALVDMALAAGVVGALAVMVRVQGDDG